MTNLPKATRQGMRSGVTALLSDGHVAAQENLTRAFVTFTQAAGSLEKSYTQLQSEVARLRVELTNANSELERSLEENARMRRYLTRVLENLPCGVLVAGADGVQIMNPEARRLLQVPADWIASRTSGDGGLPPEFAAAIARVPAGSFFCEQEIAIAGTTGDRSIGISRADISEQSGARGDTIWIVRDATEQKRLAREREAARRSLALAEVATVLAHEIRNPLGSMELFTGLLGDATAHLPETRQWITHLQAGLRTLSATVNNVLQLHGQSSPQMLPTELDRLVQETVDFLRPLARQRGQQIRVENAIGRVPTHADPNRLKQAFLNLSLNAFRSMPLGGKLVVRLGWAPQFPGGVAQIDFQDNGRGISPELLDRIYEPGFTTTVGSPGLGLTVCKKVLEEHGGEIRADSKADRGATFTVFLPVSGGQT